MFALLVITATLFLIEYRTVGGYVTAAVVFLVGGTFVEFRCLRCYLAWLSGGTARGRDCCR